ncbi:hypothetical protein [Shinella sp. BYT-45]|uniref:hypothetical protein n=1 Tax=Shinella sp. BYT-45 TaxID=3377377 RepID=UPI0039806E95
MFEWVWQPSRLVYVCGTVSVGAVFPPACPGGKWRWRMLVDGRLSPEEGKAKTQDEARQAVEKRFAAFLDRAALKPAIEGK